MPEFSPQQIEAARLVADIEFQVHAQYFTPAQRARMNRKPVPKLVVDFGNRSREREAASEKTG